ncbi:MAG: galactokinase family protein, partial [Oscillospiraceae bacterium]
MICVTDLQKDIRHGLNDKAFVKLYGTEKAIITLQKNRYVSAMQAFSDLFGKNREVSVYSTPGRTELAGNHTDHNLGIAVAGTVQADIIAIVSKNNENIVRVRSRGYDKTITVDLTQLEINENETGRSPALVRGIAAGIAHFNGKIGGFDVYTNSFILKGSGLSSSAAFEICLANIFNCEFNGGNLGLIKIAKIAQWAENVYYGKESGLLD